MASAACFLASKATEQVVKIKDIASHYLNITKTKLPNAASANITEEMIQKIAKDIAFHEFHLLAILDYNVVVNLPYQDINALIMNGNNIMARKIAKNFANDAFRTRAVIKYSSREIAEACVYLAEEFLQVESKVCPDPKVLQEIIDVYKYFL